jgi:hypothetical protein
MIHLVAPTSEVHALTDRATPADVASTAAASLERPLRPRERTGSWRTAIENQATRLQFALDEVHANLGQQAFPASRNEVDVAAARAAARRADNLQPMLERIEKDLSLAIEITQSGAADGLFRRLRELWTGSGFEQALAAVNRASEALLLVQPGPAVLARLPDLRAGVKDHLRVTDPRFDVFTRIIDAAERGAGLLPAEETNAKGSARKPAGQSNEEAPVDTASTSQSNKGSPAGESQARQANEEEPPGGWL